MITLNIQIVNKIIILFAATNKCQFFVSSYQRALQKSQEGKIRYKMTDIKILNKINSLEKQQKDITKKILELKNKKDRKQNKIDAQKKMITGSYFLNKYEKENKLNELKDLLDKYLSKKENVIYFNWINLI